MAHTLEELRSMSRADRQAYVKENCPIRRVSCTKDFIEKSNWVHCGFYDYKDTVYAGCQKDVVIICPDHGDFIQAIKDHYSHGCHECSRVASTGVYTTDREYEGSGILYHIRLSDGDTTFDKVGVTKRTVHERVREYKKFGLIVETVEMIETDLNYAVRLESSILNRLNSKRYRIHFLKNNSLSGWTECFPVGELDGVVQWAVNDTLTPIG